MLHYKLAIRDILKVAMHYAISRYEDVLSPLSYLCINVCQAVSPELVEEPLCF